MTSLQASQSQDLAITYVRYIDAKFGGSIVGYLPNTNLGPGNIVGYADYKLRTGEHCVRDAD